MVRRIALASLLVCAFACDDDPVSTDRSPDMGPRAVDAAIPADGAVTTDDGGPTDVLDGSTVGGVCPPTGPFGTEVGDVAPDVTLLDCDGNEVSLHASLCDGSVGWAFVYAEWCPPCRSFARDDVESIWQSYRDQGLSGVVVVTADASYDAPTAELCAEVRDRYGLTMAVLFDPTGALSSGLDVRSNAVNVLFTEGMRIEWKGRYAESEVEGRIAGLLE